MRFFERQKDDYKQLESKYDTLYAEKMELEYRCKAIESEYTHEKELGKEILKLHENARRLKHDMKNHLTVMAAYLQENQIEEARDYLSQILDKLNNIYTYIETGNTLMSHILNTKLEEAHSKGIHVKARIENLSFSKMNSVDFASVLTNLLDNAVEGVSSDNPMIYVEISKKRGYELILIKNTISESVLRSNPNLKSTKELDDSHETNSYVTTTKEYSHETKGCAAPKKELTDSQETQSYETTKMKLDDSHETQSYTTTTKELIDSHKTHGYGTEQIRFLTEKYGGLYDFYEEESMFCACVMIPFQ